jgi:hypothetical protein
MSRPVVIMHTPDDSCIAHCLVRAERVTSLGLHPAHPLRSTGR